MSAKLPAHNDHRSKPYMLSHAKLIQREPSVANVRVVTADVAGVTMTAVATVGGGTITRALSQRTGGAGVRANASCCDPTSAAAAAAARATPTCRRSIIDLFFQQSDLIFKNEYVASAFLSSQAFAKAFGSSAAAAGCYGR
jgi:hypothetical protein